MQMLPPPPTDCPTHHAAGNRGYAVDEALDVVLPGTNRVTQRPGWLFEQRIAVLSEWVRVGDHPGRERLGN